MTGLDEKSDVGIEEGDGHGDIVSVRENESSIESSLLDEGEDVCTSNRQSRNRMRGGRKTDSPIDHSSIQKSALATPRESPPSGTQRE